MNEKQTLQAVAETITDKPTLSFEVEVKRRHWLDRLLRRNKARQFTIRPAVVGTMLRISARAIQLHEELTDAIRLDTGKATADMGATMQLVHAHMADVVYIVAAAIQNDCEEPSERLQAFIRQNFDAEDLVQVLLPVLAGLNLQGFLNSIVLVKGTEGVLRPKTSLKEAGEMIAPGA